MRIIWIFLGLAMAVLVTFFVWGDSFEEIFTPEGSISWLEDYGSWGWAAGIVLLILDLFLPIPGTVVMSALGYIYGPLVGGTVSAIGSMLSGLTAYGLCRLAGERAARWLISARDRERGKRLFDHAGGWMIALSRWVPILAEVLTCMAGLVRMPFRKFILALACGSVPVGFAFAAVGFTGNESPVLAIVLSIGIPPLIWLAVQPLLRRMGK